MSEGEFDRTMTGMHLELGAGTILRDVPVAQWQTRLFAAERSADVGRGVAFTVEGDSVAVVNGSPFDIRSAVLLQGGRVPATTPIGAIPAGSRKDATLGRSGFEPLRDLGLSEEDIVGRSVVEWTQQQTWARYSGPPILVCVLDPSPEQVEADVSRREAGTLWVVLSAEGRP
jgi:hypothetical protein